MLCRRELLTREGVLCLVLISTRGQVLTDETRDSIGLQVVILDVRWLLLKWLDYLRQCLVDVSFVHT